ncbi:flagellar hook-length control protein FliK [Paenibacillus sp. FSL K6-1230]|uniref:flagellar hook-length control protein FliK n=1 Tax=Paenibacillus sp. FSL K6-1230 TaxID=2921603 RepID=UPI0030F931F6
MTMVAGNISMSSPASTTSTSSTTSAGNTATTGTGGFTAALNQVMGQSTSGDSGAESSTGNLLTMMVVPQEADVEGAEALLNLLPALLEGLKELDDEIEASPELLAALQNWLQQVQQLLPSDLSNNGTGQAVSTTITLLAQDPSTIRFAIQEALTQLVALTNNQQNSQVANKAARLLQSLQEMMKNTDVFPKELEASVDRAIKQLPSVAVRPAETNEMKQVLPTALNLSRSDAQENASASNQESSLLDAKTTPITTAGQLVVQNHGTSSTGPATSTVHIRQFTSEMTDFVVQKFDIVKQLGVTEAKISLRPEHLGQLDIKLSMHNGQLVAQFVTERIGAKDLLEQQMSQLRISLQNQGIQVSKVEVTQSESASSYMYQDGKGAGSQQQQSERRSKPRTEEESEDAVKISEMVEELRNWNEEQTAIREENTTSFTARA